MFWISLGSTSSKLPDKPSIKTRGEFPALEKVPVPLIFTEAPAPGLPEFCNTLKPGASPANACAVLVTGLLANSLADTEETEPVRFTFSVCHILRQQLHRVVLCFLLIRFGEVSLMWHLLLVMCSLDS